MRLLFLFSIAVSLAACGGSPRDTVRGPQPLPVSEAAGACYARLDALPGVDYRPLEARRTPEGCGFDDGVQLLDIGVPVSGLTAISCPAAEAMTLWLRESVQPAARAEFGSDVVRVQSFGTYNCRTINNRPGGRLSEHALGRAVDIAAFTLADGRTVRVESDWRAGGDREAFLRRVHRAACDRFANVLGPDADRFHQDHFHLDVRAGRRPGSFCR
ncbi:MAG: extensin family protein [Pacificimonas sp.]